MWILMLGQYSPNKTIRNHVGHASKFTYSHRLACPNEANGVESMCLTPMLEDGIRNNEYFNTDV